MKPAPFKYAVARSLEEALDLKTRHGEDARFLSGGQSLIPTMNFRLAQPEMLIDLNGLDDLATIESMADGGVRIGALARHCAVERSSLLRRTHPIVCEAEREVAHPQIRNRGTLCGNLAHADPASEMPAVMLVQGARMQAKSGMGERWIDAQAFFLGVFETALAEEEMLTAVELPTSPAGTGGCFLELARRPGDYAMAGVAATVTLDADGACTDARLAFCGVGESPVLAEAAARVLIGTRIETEAAREAAETAAGQLAPTADVQASAEYKRHLASVLARRAVCTAADRARGAQAQTTAG